MKIVTAEEMRAIDRATTEKYGVASLTLMENAGAAVAEFAQKHFEFNTVCVVCGKGNNGGDGFVAARKLREAGKQVVVLVLAKDGNDLRGDAAEMFKKLALNPLWIADESEFSKADVQQALKSDLIVDAIVGTGFKPPLKGLARRVVEVINDLGTPILAVDLPSGAYSDSFLPAKDQGVMVQADAIITFTAPKTVHVFGGTTEGAVAVANIGSPDDLILASNKLDIEAYVPAYLNVLYRSRPADAHKGDFGHVLVVGGSVGKSGAAAMAGMAALRAGAGLVTVACPRSVQPTVAAFAPEIMTEPLPETTAGTLSAGALDLIEALIEKKDAVVLGPGLSRNEETDRLIRALLPALAKTRVVLDADGLNAFAGHADELRTEGLLVLTPHPGELSRLTGTPIDAIESKRLETAREVASKFGSIVVLKGHRTITSSPSGQVWINLTGNPGMAKGGSGDVLSGMIAASFHQMQSGFFRHSSQAEGMRLMELIHRRDQGDAAAKQELEERGRHSLFDMFAFWTASAVCLHGLAGDIARDLQGESSMLATDIISNIGEALAVCQRARQDEFTYLQR